MFFFFQNLVLTFLKPSLSLLGLPTNSSIMLAVKNIRVKQQKKTVVKFRHGLGSASAQVKFEFDTVGCVVDVVGCGGNMCMKMILNEYVR